MFEGRFVIKENFDGIVIIDTAYDNTPYFMDSCGIREIVDILNELDEICESLRGRVRK